MKNLCIALLLSATAATPLSAQLRAAPAPTPAAVPAQNLNQDIAACEEIFTTLMGEDVESRRKFIEENALDVKNLDI